MALQQQHSMFSHTKREMVSQLDLADLEKRLLKAFWKLDQTGNKGGRKLSSLQASHYTVFNFSGRSHIICFLTILTLAREDNYSKHPEPIRRSRTRPDEVIS